MRCVTSMRPSGRKARPQGLLSAAPSTRDLGRAGAARRRRRRAAATVTAAGADAGGDHRDQAEHRRAQGATQRRRAGAGQWQVDRVHAHTDKVNALAAPRCYELQPARCLPAAARSLFTAALPPRPPSAAAGGRCIRPAPRGRPGARARPPARRGRTRSRRAAGPAWRTCSFRCFSPTSRCDSTSTSSQNSGASKAWPQTWASSAGHRLEVEVLERQRAVGADASRQRRGVEPLGGHALQRLVEGVEVRFGQRAAGRHRVAAEAHQHAGVALGDEVERVAQVKARDRAARALQRAVGAAREDEGRPVQPVLQAAGDDADHAFVEFAGRTATARPAARPRRSRAAGARARPRPARACRPRPRGARG